MTIKDINLLGNNSIIGAFLLSIAIFSEIAGLFTQHYLGFAPCSLCVEMRAYIALIGLGAVFLLLAGSNGAKRHKLLVTTGFTVAIIASVKTFLIARVGLLIERGEILSTCSAQSSFPSYLPLDTWLPSVFMHFGVCGKSPVIAFNFTIMELSFYGFAALSLLIIALSIFTIRRSFSALPRN
ncbi:disulfide bond formation protein B [Vibrio splendidus]|nr:disulfide bond formation protein B [Vibrio splendidus]MCC4880459.1 disulfide bond formation protein B [Vibrio splendidus]